MHNLFDNVLTNEWKHFQEEEKEGRDDVLSPRTTSNVTHGEAPYYYH